MWPAPGVADVHGAFPSARGSRKSSVAVHTIGEFLVSQQLSGVRQARSEMEMAEVTGQATERYPGCMAPLATRSRIPICPQDSDGAVAFGGRDLLCAVAEDILQYDVVRRAHGETGEAHLPGCGGQANSSLGKRNGFPGDRI